MTADAAATANDNATEPDSFASSDRPAPPVLAEPSAIIAELEATLEGLRRRRLAVPAEVAAWSEENRQKIAARLAREEE